MLEFNRDEFSQWKHLSSTNSVVIAPCYIGEGVKLENSVVGPHVSVGNNTTIVNARVENAIVGENTFIAHTSISNSMLGNHVTFNSHVRSVSIGDYSTVD